jgi:hypothetical protein
MWELLLLNQAVIVFLNGRNEDAAPIRSTSANGIRVYALLS